MDAPLAAFGLIIIVIALLGAFAELYVADPRPDVATWEWRRLRP